MYLAASGAGGGIKPAINIKSFFKVEEGNHFYVLPVVSEPLFPQFKGPSSPGVVHTKHQQGGCRTVSGCVLRRLIAQLARAIGRISLNPSSFISSVPFVPPY